MSGFNFLPRITNKGATRHECMARRTTPNKRSGTVSACPPLPSTATMVHPATSVADSAARRYLKEFDL